MTSAPTDSPPTDPPPPDNQRIKIHNWPDTTDDAKVIRYMKLSNVLIASEQPALRPIHPTSSGG